MSTKWPPVIFVTNLLGTGACPGPTTKALSRAGGVRRTTKLGRILEQHEEESGPGRRAELGAVMADMDVNVPVNGGREAYL